MCCHSMLRQCLALENTPGTDMLHFLYLSSQSKTDCVLFTNTANYLGISLTNWHKPKVIPLLRPNGISFLVLLLVPHILE